MDFGALLIQEVKKYPELYKMELPGYMNLFVKNKHYDNVAMELNKRLKTNVSSENIKIFWERLLKDYCDFKKKQILLKYNSQAREESLPPPHTMNLFKMLSFVHEKEYAVKVIAPTRISKESCIWEDEDDILLQKCKKKFIVPESDKFCQVKMATADENFKLEMSDLISSLKSSASMYSGKMNALNKNTEDLEVYETPIFSYFDKIEDEDTRNEMMREMLQEIIKFPQKKSK